MIRLVCTVYLLCLATGLTAEERPNILFAIADDASFPHMSAYGTPWVDTPAFDRVAKEGLLFTRCYTPNAKCAPSRACILTGRNSWQLEEAANHWCYFPTKFPSFMEVIAKHGYVTGFTGKGWAPGVARDSSGEPRQLTGKRFSMRRTEPPTKFISANDYAANFLGFLDQSDSSKPFCFWYGSTEPHRRYEYESGVNQGGKSIDTIERVPSFWPDSEVVRNDMLDYAFEIEHFDMHLGRMIDALEERQLLENTIIVVTSDNGMPFPRVKGNCYEWSNHLPLAVMWPSGIKSPGRTVNDLVSFIDFAPTFFEMAGIDWSTSGMEPTSGVSLLGLMRKNSQRPHRKFVLIGKERHDIGRPGDVGYPVRGIVTQEFLYVRNEATERWPSGNPETGYLNTDGSPTKTQILDLRRHQDESSHWETCFGKRPPQELYNLASDPTCMTNLANDENYTSVRDAMVATMEDQLRAENDPRILGQGELFDGYPNANPADVGFYEKYLQDPKSVKAPWVNPSDFEPQEATTPAP